LSENSPLSHKTSKNHKKRTFYAFEKLKENGIPARDEKYREYLTDVTQFNTEATEKTEFSFFGRVYPG